MNTQDFKVQYDVEICLKDNLAFFVLSNDDDYVVCTVEAEKKIVKMDVQACLEPQESFEADFAYLVVGDKKLKIDDSTFDIDELKLTEEQLKDLNKFLKDLMEMV